MRRASPLNLSQAGAAFVVLALAAVPLEAQGPELAMLDGLTKGAWDLRNREDGTHQRICVRDGRAGFRTEPHYAAHALGKIEF